MPNDVLVVAYSEVLRGLEFSAPKNLERRAFLEAADIDPSADVSITVLLEHLEEHAGDSPLRPLLARCLAAWDAASPAEWNDESAPRSGSRREIVYKRLGFNIGLTRWADDTVPIHRDGTTVISTKFVPWYPPRELDQRAFYWPRYRDYLQQRKGWKSVADLDTATTKVVERMSDPTRVHAFSARGLVVGHVQSGKTANFAGLIAKAIDAGYRLVVVLTGTVEILRQQTQRRIDMELVGLENLASATSSGRDEDYLHDPAFPQGFLSFGFRPSDHGFPDIIPLTGHNDDYKRLGRGILALEFDKVDRSKPLFDPVNLFACRARVAVVKKNGIVLKRLIDDLKKFRDQLGQIPTLIIDDESDQASVNTVNPEASEGVGRTTINARLAELLEMLPRAQYVGYTATPFANVFVDPEDAFNIFPKDFVIALEPPPQYMGVKDFHDIDSDVAREERTIDNSNEMAHVRDLSSRTEEDREQELAVAIDSFVISAAIKLYRTEHTAGQLDFPHHTMLVHESMRTAEQGDLADLVRRLWRRAGYSSASCKDRLRSHFLDDFLPVCRVKAGAHPYPPTYEDLWPYVGPATQKITEVGGDPVIVVNANTDLSNEAIDFDKRPVWRILVGGNKLSRGFTVEGLTISYYRRRILQSDSLMQMGRWFGFRAGYRDLVRLYIGRQEPFGRFGSVDLYEAFEAVLRDEEAFRRELHRYSRLDSAGEPEITPRQIPPLVAQHMPTVRPTARNKMFNAEQVVRWSAGELVEPNAFPTEETLLRANYEALAPVAAAATEDLILKTGSPPSVFGAKIGIVSHAMLLDALRRQQWPAQGYFDADLEYLERSADEIDDWVVIMPQPVRGKYVRQLPLLGERRVFARRRRMIAKASLGI